jgi:hypothetical protein
MKAATSELAERTRAPLQRIEGTCPTATCLVSTVTGYVSDAHRVPVMML